jgi:hypothetical protein
MCRSRLSSIIFFVLHIIFVAVLLQPTIALEDRLMYCVGSLPKGDYGLSFLAEETRKKLELFRPLQPHLFWSARNFTRLSDLCTADGNPNGNLGGRVRTSNT